MICKPIDEVREKWLFRWGFFLLSVVLIALLKSGSVLHFSTFEIDEPYVVRYAVGFLGGDLNPRWFNYHTLPMYILAGAYYLIYGLLSFAGAVTSKIEFASQLYENGNLFFISGRILCSIVYTAGCFILSYIVYKHFRSAIGAVALFVASNLIPDSIAASNYIRNDTFAFLFFTLMVYFGMFAPKKFSSFLLATVFCAATFTSKFPALVFIPILFLQIASDAWKGSYPRIYLAYYVVLLPVFSFLFMPYAVLDYPLFKETIDMIFSRASGTFVHVGKEQLNDFGSRIGVLVGYIRDQVGIVPIIGTILFSTYALIRDRKLLFLVVYVFVYAGLFSTSLVIDTYWLRPVYPMFLFFTVLCWLTLWRSKFIGQQVQPIVQRLSRDKILTFGFCIVGIGLFFLFLTINFTGSIGSLTKNYIRDNEDTRITARRWIEENLPANVTVWLEGNATTYFPKILPTDLKIARILPLGYHSHEFYNQFLNDAFQYYYRRALTTHKAFNVGILDGLDEKAYYNRPTVLKPDNYIVLSNYFYYRFFTESTKKNQPALAAVADKYYTFLRRQQLVKKFNGVGPTIEIYRINESLNPKDM